MPLEAGPEFEALVDYLRDKRGFDFTGYKRPTLVRRISSRCAELGIDSFGSYIDYLEVHADEFQILFDKVLINVTEFFRDRRAWEYLAQEIVPRIAANDGPIRVWSAGTASGEEAYSAAMMLSEALGPEQFSRRVKVYATDMDEEALSKARVGYLAKDLKSLDKELRDGYMEQQGSRYVFKASLRRVLIFGRHDLMQDAPISRLDLLICRNTLIHFTAESQARILTRFHYALNDNGYLFLGRAEMLMTHGSLFVPVDPKQRVFVKVAQPQLRERLLLLSQSVSADPTTQVARVRARDLATEGLQYGQLLIDVSGVLVSANAVARQLFGLTPGDVGRPLRNLEVSYKPIDLRTPIDRVSREHRPVALPAVELQTANGTRLYDAYVAPLIDDDGSFVGTSVSFTDVTQMVQLRTDLERAKQEVETAYEELETTNEELQSTVEELETTNEELQSSNEELETMNEELESTNTELHGINSDLRLRTDEVNRLNTFLRAVTGNIELGAIVIDSDMRVQVWNERAADMWGLRSDEVVGMPLFELDIGLPLKEITGVVRLIMSGASEHRTVDVDATNRRGKQIRCRLLVHSLSDGSKSSGGAVIVIEELKSPVEQR